ncbi:MAG TPA: hypothetical protein VFT37_15905 [Telluria sp.]|nr:hypothetical protein [Telluria sp.]
MPSFTRSSRILAIVIASATMFGAGAAKAETPPPELARALQAVADSADDAWNRRDPAAMVAHYADGATATIGNNQQVSGKGELLAFFTNSFKGLPAGMTHRTVVKRIETIGEMKAVDSAVYLEMPDGAGGKRIVREFFTFALVRPGNHGWEFVAVRAVPLGVPPVRTVAIEK